MPNRKKTILLIDDDAQLIHLLHEKLENSGFGVLDAHNGVSGIAMAKEKEPDLIILDLRMPGMNGAEVLAALKSDEAAKNIKVIIFTFFNQFSGLKFDETTAKKIGADAFIEKESDLDEIVKKVKDLLGIV